MHRHIRQPAAYGDVLRKRLAVAAVLLAEVGYVFQQALCPRRAVDAGALEVQQRRAHIPAAVQLAHKVLFGNARALKGNQRAVRVPHHRYLFNRDAVLLKFGQQETDAAMLGRVRLGSRQHKHPVGA